jgi:hypothetical protein
MAGGKKSMNKDFDLLHVRIVGFSGQQNLLDPSSVAQELRRQLESMHLPGRRLMALSSLRGLTDLLFAKEALGLSIPLVLVLSISSEELRKKFSGEAAVELDQVLQKVTRIEMLLLPREVDAATRLGQKLVDETDILVTVSDGGTTVAAGDTAEVMEYASRRGRQVIHLCEDAKGISVRDLKSEHDLVQPPVSVDQLQEMLEEPPDHTPIPEGLLKYFHACDTHATQTAPQVRRYVLNIVLANGVASMAGSVGSSFNHSAVIGTVLTVIKFGCIFLGLGIFAVLRHRQSRNHWLGLRLKAEVCRSAMATWNCPIPVDPLSPDDVPELRPLIQALRYFRATRPPTAEFTLEKFKADYGKRRLVDQYYYFQRQADSATLLSSRLTPLYWILSGSALLLSGAALIIPSFYTGHHPLGKWTNFVFVFIPIVAPALASWIVAWQAIESVSRKKARFVEMGRLMHQALIDLIHCHSWEAVQHVVKKTEKQLLNEVLEWYSFVKYSS